MCGRFTSTSTVEELVDAFSVDEVRTGPLPARYNVAPTHDVYAVAVARGRRVLGTFRWGLVPGWAADPGGGARMINARAESLASRPAFRDALARRRCIVPADGFFEWQQRAGAGGRPGGRLPYLFRRRDGAPLALAGLWEVWRDPADPGRPPLRTCTIITVPADRAVSAVHHRMPAMLDPADWAAWLDPGSAPSVVEALLAACPPPGLEGFPVSSLVNSVANDRPELVEPLPPPPEALSLY